jgi:hypothetical protein
MESYIFALFVGRRETYREEILALTVEDARSMAAETVEHKLAGYSWTMASLSDETGRVVWRVSHAYPRTPGH